MSIEPQADRSAATRLKAALLGAIGSFVMFAAYLAIPPIGIFSGVLAPFPTAYNRLIHGRLAALITMLGATAATTALFGVFAGCLYLGMCGIIGLCMPEFLARGISGSRTIFWTTSATLAFMLAGTLIYSYAAGHDLRQMISSEIASSMTQAATIYEKSGVKGEDLELLKQSMKTVSDLLNLLYPALITAMFAVMSGCNLALLKRTVDKSGLKLNIGEFGSYRNPDLLVWLLIAAGFSTLLPSPLYTVPAVNVLILVSLLYFIQGMAVVGVIISKQSFSGLLKTTLYVMLIFQPYLAALIAALGLFDLWADFRAPNNKQENL